MLADSRLQETLYLLLEANHAETARAIATANQGMRAGFLLIGAGGILALLAGVVIAWLAIRTVADTQARLEREKELAEVTLHSIVDGVITTDAAGLIEYHESGRRAVSRAGRAREARGTQLAEVYRVIDERTGQPIETLPVTGRARGAGGGDGRCASWTATGARCPVRYSHAPIRGRDGTVHGMIVVFHDVSQIRAMAQQLIWQASHDALTGLVNRREFERRLAELIETAQEQGREHALLFMDLDGFKTVNDTCGHSAGDELLRQLTAIMLSRMRGSDTLARLGGDEFGALLESLPDGPGAAHRQRDARDGARIPLRVGGQDLQRRASAWASCRSPPTAATSSRCSRLADACCYEAKSKGRDRVQVYRPRRERATASKHARAADRLADQPRLRAGPVPALPPAHRAARPRRAHREPHYEVLVRMLDRAGNLVPATGFMPAAERYNLLTSIERWVVSSLVEYLHRQWTSGAIPREPRTRRARLLFGEHLRRQHQRQELPRFPAQPAHALPAAARACCASRSPRPPRSPISPRRRELMHELKGMGCRFALDDFGTGMSSFAYLKYLPVDYLKIAGVFVKDMATDPMDHAIVDAVNRIGHILGMQTVAESVEDAETLARITALGIDYAQGYFIAEPEAFAVETTAQQPDGAVLAHERRTACSRRISAAPRRWWRSRARGEPWPSHRGAAHLRQPGFQHARSRHSRISWRGPRPPRTRRRIAAACFAVAGPVAGNGTTLTNLGWRIEARALAARFALPAVALINDFAAAGLGIARLAATDLVTLQAGQPREHGDAARRRRRHRARAWDGSTWDGEPLRRASLPRPATPISRRSTSCRTGCSSICGATSGACPASAWSPGPGLMRIFSFLQETGAGAPSREMMEAIARAARTRRRSSANSRVAKRDPLAVRALDLFVAAYGAFAGNMALATLAHGGVYIAGGIAPKIVAKLQDGAFMRAFVNKGRFSDAAGDHPGPRGDEPAGRALRRAARGGSA